MTPTKKLIERAKFTLKDVPEGPWRNNCPAIYSRKKDKANLEDRHYYSSKVAFVPEVYMDRKSREVIANFICESRTLIPQLIEHLERYERALDKCKEQRDDWRMKHRKISGQNFISTDDAELEAILNPQEKGEM